MRNALVQGNYARFFKLYRMIPNQGKALVDVFIDKLRVMALQNIVMGYIATNIELSHLQILLAFADLEETNKFLVDRECILVENEGGPGLRLDCRKSVLPIKKAPLKVRRCSKWVTN